MDTVTAPTSVFEDILLRLNQEGEYTTTVLTSEDGLPIAAAPMPPRYDPDTLAAMVAMVRDFIQQTQERLGLDPVDEVSIVVGDRSRLICRYFCAAERSFVLAVVAPPDVSYRRLTTRAIRDLKQAWGADGK